MSPEDIARRAKRIRLPIGQLAFEAGCARGTAQRTLLGHTDPRHSTLRALGVALTEEELALRDHLCALHGIPQVNGREAA